VIIGERIPFEIFVGNLGGAGISIWIAGHLTKNPVISTSKGKNDSGASLADERSENGNLIRITDPSEGETMLHPPQVGSSLQKEMLRLIRLFQKLIPLCHRES